MKIVMIFLQVIFIIGMIFSFSIASDNQKDILAVVSKEKQHKNGENLNLIYNEEENSTNIYEEVDSLDDKAKKLTGTCPRGLSCTAPSCGAWSDINKDGACDRGVE